jgi:predicted nucleotidyltransferase
LRIEPNLKKKIAKEAATLLYLGIEKEYKQAKMKAAKTFASKFLPSNYEIALELDSLTEEREGSRRKILLVKMRKNALIVMKVLKKFNPILIGSVWRGTINQYSDIDIRIYYNKPKEIIDFLEKKGFKIFKTKRINITKRGVPKSALHINLINADKQMIEITVRNIDQQFNINRCEIFGDRITGLRIRDLENILKKNPSKKFIPFNYN